MKSIGVLILVSGFLVACGTATPTSQDISAVQTRMARDVIATMTAAAPASSPTPTATESAGPTSTPAAAATPLPPALTPVPPSPTLPRPSPTPEAQPPLQITLTGVHYEQETAQGGRYFHTNWTIYNHSDQTLYHVWRPKFYIAVGDQTIGWTWAEYYHCESGWPAGQCYGALEQDQPDIGSGQTVGFVWYVITENPDQWVQYASLEGLGWTWWIEFDMEGQILSTEAEPQ